MIPDTRSATMLPIMRRKIVPDPVVYTDSTSAYDILDVAGFRHWRINHCLPSGRETDPGGDGYVEKVHNHIDGIENFRNQAKRQLRRYNSIPKDHFPLFIKEAEFRFNYGSPSAQLRTLRRWVKLATK